MTWTEINVDNPPKEEVFTFDEKSHTFAVGYVIVKTIGGIGKFAFCETSYLDSDDGVYYQEPATHYLDPLEIIKP